MPQALETVRLGAVASRDYCARAVRSVGWATYTTRVFGEIGVCRHQESDNAVRASLLVDHPQREGLGNRVLGRPGTQPAGVVQEGQRIRRHRA